MVLKALSDLATGFEGCEKKLEIDFHLTKEGKTLRDIDRKTWDGILDEAKCTIIGITSNEHLDAYVLSESSLFVYPTKIMIKTCGTTCLLNCLVKLLAAAKEVGAEPDFLQFSRSSFLFPHNQPFPHRNFQMETQYLNTLFQGQAYVLGPINGPRWHLYIVDFNRVEASKYEQQTLELVMFNLDPEVMKTFYRRQDGAEGEQADLPEKSTATSNFDPSTLPADADASKGSRNSHEATMLSGIHKLLPGSTIDSFLFNPCGYSCNGILDKAYFTIHITPEPECSFVSFETNADMPNYTELVKMVLDIFKPGTFSMSLFVDQNSSISDSRSGTVWDFEGYSSKGVTHHLFEGGYNATCGQYELIQQRPSVFGQNLPKFFADEKNDQELLDMTAKLALPYDTARRFNSDQIHHIVVEAIRARNELENFEDPKGKMVLQQATPVDVNTNLRKLAGQVIKQHRPDDAFCLVDVGELARRFAHWAQQFKAVEPIYTIHGNLPEEGVVAALNALGVSFACYSAAALEHLLRLGVRPSRLAFYSAWKPVSQITFAATKNVETASFENLADLRRLHQNYPQAKLLLHIATPICQEPGPYHYEVKSSTTSLLDEKALVGVGAGAGASISDVVPLLEEAKKLGVNLVGVRYSFKQQVTDLELHYKALDNAKYVMDLTEKYGFTPSTLDIGNGFPLHSRVFDQDGQSIAFEDIASKVSERVEQLFPYPIRVMASCTNFFAHSSHTLVLNVVAKRKLNHGSEEKQYEETYAYYVKNPPIISAEEKVHLEPSPLTTNGTGVPVSQPGSPNKVSRKRKYQSIIVGVDEAETTKVAEHQLDELEVGDWLLLPHVGCALTSSHELPVKYIHT